MSFAKFSNDYLIETFTLVDNLFINEHLPYLDEKQIKVYLYGLYLSANPSEGNTVDALCSRLDMTENDLMNALGYFEDMGLIEIASKNPLEVKYLSLKRSMQPPKKYRSEKWHDFNTHLQQLFPERMLTPNEYNEYYMFLDETKLAQDAMLMIVQYCINLKGANVRYPYILTVARNWVADGVRTAADVEDKLNEYDQQSDAMRQVLSALSRKGGAELEEKQMLLKWMKSWGYELNAITTAAKLLKGTKTFAKLDARLDEFYRMSIFSSEEMLNWQLRREELKEIAVAVNKNLGVYYESFEHEIEVYIAPWMAKGFENQALKKIAHHCFISNVRTLEGMNSVVNSFYSQGLLTVESIDAYLEAQIKQDENIKRIIKACGAMRGVTASDREYYRTWTAEWGFDDETLLYAAEQALGKPYPTSYMNQLLSAYKLNGIKDAASAKKFSASSLKPAEKDYAQREYSPEELRSIATSIDSLNIEDI